MPDRRYYWCKICQTVLRGPRYGVEHCGEKATYITDKTARERIEGRPFKGRRMKLKGKVDAKGDREKWRYRGYHKGRQDG